MILGVDYLEFGLGYYKRWGNDPFSNDLFMESSDLPDGQKTAIDSKDSFLQIFSNDVNQKIFAFDCGSKTSFKFSSASQFFLQRAASYKDVCYMVSGRSYCERT